MLQILGGHSDTIFMVSFSLDGGLLASGSSDHTVRLWDPARGQLLKVLEGHKDKVKVIAFSPDGSLLASGSDDHTVRLWDPTRGQMLKVREGHENLVMSIAFSPNGRSIASGCFDGRVWLWEVLTGAGREGNKVIDGFIWSIKFSPDSSLLASIGCQSLDLWDPATGAWCGRLGDNNCYRSRLIRFSVIEFSSDSCLLASGSSDSIIRLWDPIRRVLIGLLEGHTGSIETLSFSPNGRSSCLWSERWYR